MSILDILKPDLHRAQGTSTKHNPQRVGMAHILEDEDVVQIIKK